MLSDLSGGLDALYESGANDNPGDEQGDHQAGLHLSQLVYPVTEVQGVVVEELLGSWEATAKQSCMVGLRNCTLHSKSE